VDQQQQNTGRRRWSVYVGRRTSRSQTNRVDADGRRIPVYTQMLHGKISRSKLRWVISAAFLQSALNGGLLQ